jgi:hypothetical protein
MVAFVLVHSPLAGPVTWEPLAVELARRGCAVRTPDLGGAEADAEPFWRRHTRAAADVLRSLPPEARPLLAGHSAAGALLPAIREAAGRPVAGYLFVDAHLPRDGLPRAEGERLASLSRLYAAGGRCPDWSPGVLREAVPDPSWRARLAGELRPPPWPYWEETIPVFAGWPDAPCAFLRFTPNAAYDGAAGEARSQGWPCRELAGGHFHMLVDAPAVADALLALARELGVDV